MIRALRPWLLAGLGLGVMTLAACGGGGDDDNAVTPDAAPCELPAEGVCAGNVAQHCVDGALVTEDCTATLETCTLDGASYGCLDECVVAGVGDAGTCSGDAIRRCGTVDGHHAVVTEACPSGNTCAQPTGQPAACVANLCADIGALGRCEGNTLVKCNAGTPASTDCAATGQVCGFGGDATGYACLAAGAMFTVHGTVRYEDRVPQTSGALAPITQAVVRGAQVAVVADTGSTVLATGITADDGTYTLRYDSTEGTQVHILVTAQSTIATRPVRVLRAQNQVHGFGAPSFSATADATQDVLVTDASGLSEAFNILDQGIRAMDMIRNGMGDMTPTPLTARWVRGGNTGTYYSGRTIYLLGASSDDDGYDDTVILHEIGHFVEDTEGRSDSPGGSHDGSPTDPTLAWSEGFSTYFNMAVRGAPHYMDSNSGGGWGYNADTSLTRAMAGAIGQDVSEDMISEILWDIGDGGSGDDDPASASTHIDVLRVQVDYLATATLRNVGMAGVDLVDFLDGWFVGEGLSSCGGVRSVVTTTRTFPYDYNAPNAHCP